MKPEFSQEDFTDIDEAAVVVGVEVSKNGEHALIYTRSTGMGLVKRLVVLSSRQHVKELAQALRDAEVSMSRRERGLR